MQTYTIEKAESIDLSRVEFINSESSKKVPLVLIGKSVNPPPSVLGEKSEKESLSARLKKWSRHAAYREIINSKAANFCHRGVIPGRENVDILQTPAGRFGYGGLFSCGSVWLCPVCASKISEKRRIELGQALKVAEAKGLHPLHLTLTAPHHLGEKLDDLLEKMTHARKLMLNRKPWKRLAASLGLKGSIRALEVTHGDSNGWHVHFHVILIISEKLTEDQIQETKNLIYDQWLSASLTVGLQPPSLDHGVNLADGRAAGDYVSKWGLEHEMTKAHIKKGREGGLSPFEFLDKYIEGDARYKGLFLEYAKAFKGRRQLVWSEGLRELLKMGPEQTDEEIADQEDLDSLIFAKLPLDVWRVILKQEKRAEVLEVCRYGHTSLTEYLRALIENFKRKECYA